MIIAIDFDGTCTTNDFPNIGKDIGAVPVLKELIAHGHQIILWTMRSDPDTIPEYKGKIFKEDCYLTAAVNWFKENDIELYGIQENPTQSKWTNSPKAYAEVYIDDAALGIPLKLDLDLSVRKFVDWEATLELLIERAIIK